MGAFIAIGKALGLLAAGAELWQKLDPTEKKKIVEGVAKLFRFGSPSL